VEARPVLGIDRLEVADKYEVGRTSVCDGVGDMKSVDVRAACGRPQEHEMSSECAGVAHGHQVPMHRRGVDPDGSAPNDALGIDDGAVDCSCGVTQDCGRG